MVMPNNLCASQTCKATAGRNHVDHRRSLCMRFDGALDAFSFNLHPLLNLGIPRLEQDFGR